VSVVAPEAPAIAKLARATSAATAVLRNISPSQETVVRRGYTTAVNVPGGEKSCVRENFSKCLERNEFSD
jgi:hypothetical protein